MFLADRYVPALLNALASRGLRSPLPDTLTVVVVTRFPVRERVMTWDDPDEGIGITTGGGRAVPDVWKDIAETNDPWSGVSYV